MSTVTALAGWDLGGLKPHEGSGVSCLQWREEVLDAQNRNWAYSNPTKLNILLRVCQQGNSDSRVLYI